MELTHDGWLAAAPATRTKSDILTPHRQRKSRIRNHLGRAAHTMLGHADLGDEQQPACDACHLTHCDCD